jgi:hypothetical protein
MTAQSVKLSEFFGALTEIFCVEGSETTALLARLKHYQRLGFQPTVNRGCGKSARYTINEAVMIAAALDLSLCGVTPERVMEMLCPREERLLASASRGSDFVMRPSRALGGSRGACRFTIPVGTMRCELLRRLPDLGGQHE